MLRLVTFGGPAVTNQDGDGVVVQRLRLALLALLAGAGERGLSRDKLLGFLWAESAPDAARHKLEQALYMLRRQLGEDLFEGADPIKLNSKILTADVTEFERAIDRADFEDAVSRYRGPFLDGFYLNDAEEFERWAESERNRLAERYRAALLELARHSAEQGDLGGAVEWWRKLAAEDPLSSRATLGLMRALAAAGDRPAALRQAQIYEQLLREELQSDPDPTVHAFMEELRAASVAAPRVASDRIGIPSQSSEQLRESSSEKPMPPPASAAKSPAHVRRQSRVVIALAGALGLVLFIILVFRHWAGLGTANVAAAHRIVVVPFLVDPADSSVNYLRDGMVDLLAEKLVGEVGPVAVDPRTTLSAWHEAIKREGAENQAAEVRLARGVGADQILDGSAVHVGQNVVLNGTVRTAADQRVLARASVTGPADSVLRLIDSLAARLLALQAGLGGQQLSLLTTTSLPALQAYLDGRSAYRRGETSVAMTDYSRALELDSTFALAAVDLVVSSGWVFTWVATNGFPYRIPMGGGRQVGQVMHYQQQWIQAMDVAWRNRQRLSKRDLETLIALRGPQYPSSTRAAESLNAWRRVTQDAPDRADTWYIVGRILMYQGPAMGIPDARERATAAFRQALSLDSQFAPALAGLLELAAQSGDSAEVRRRGDEYLARDSVGEAADYVRWHVAAVTRDAARLRAIRGRFDSLDIETLDRIQWTAQVEAIDLEDADRAMRTMMHRSPDNGYVLHFAIHWALNRGRPRDALRIFELKRRHNPGLYDWFRMLYGALWDSDSAAAAESALYTETHKDPLLRDSPRRWGLVQWWLAHGDTVRALEECERLRKEADADETMGRRREISLMASLVIASIRKKENLPELLAKADTASSRGCCDIPIYTNLILARAHERAGDLPGALAAVRRERWYSPPEFLSVSLREEGRLAALAGDTAGAIAAYRHYLALRSDPEPALRPDADRIRRELARLQK